jgi:hypothetical protein
MGQIVLWVLVTLFLVSILLAVGAAVLAGIGMAIGDIFRDVWDGTK